MSKIMVIPDSVPHKSMLLQMHNIAVDGYSGHTNVSNYIVAMSKGFRGDKNSSVWFC